MNNLLQNQLSKYHGENAALSPELQPLLDVVSRAYDDFDEERRLLERSIDLSSGELGKANSQLNKRACELEGAYSELEAFSHSISHDLRAPLRHVDGFVELLISHASEKLEERERYYLRVIADSARQMDTLIDDLLAFSRMGRTEMHRTTIATAAMVHEVIRLAMTVEPKERNIVWKVGPLPDVESDPSMLRQIWTNLVDNAIKYSRARQPALIEIGSDETHPDEIVFFIRDNGVGFDMQYADRLFGIFQRFHRAEDFEGTGIGLANVRRIITRHDGRTWAQARKNEGATFFFSLPKTAQEDKE
ncbi:MAG TPA: ATP-binding protein [Candidatus Methylacidiphilales bacterium]